jgi:hypothetical protein
VHRIRFDGRVLPAALRLSIPNFPSVRWKDGGLTALGIDQADCHVQVQDNEVTIEVDLNLFDLDRHLTPMAMRAHDTVRAAVDLVCFASGNGYTFVLETWTDLNGVTRPVAPQQPALAALSTSVAMPIDFHNVLQMVITDPPLFMALRDLIEAITQWHRAPIGAARAVEAMRHSMSPNQERKKQWEAFCQNLQLERSYIDPITDTSTGPRHGDPEHIPGSITTDVAARAWTIMNRYLEFRKRGGQHPLSLADFPVLA